MWMYKEFVPPASGASAASGAVITVWQFFSLSGSSGLPLGWKVKNG